MWGILKKLRMLARKYLVRDAKRAVHCTGCVVAYGGPCLDCARDEAAERSPL